ncbi:hypothetical alanine, arginine and proline rich protein [Mycobacterium tuberculosis T17]|nr:hypothetical alanine, arginine and proline rich protein [Mycobacterium tuberculosis T17]
MMASNQTAAQHSSATLQQAPRSIDDAGGVPLDHQILSRTHRATPSPSHPSSSTSRRRETSRRAGNHRTQPGGRTPRS